LIENADEQKSKQKRKGNIYLLVIPTYRHEWHVCDITTFAAVNAIYDLPLGELTAYDKTRAHRNFNNMD